MGTPEFAVESLNQILVRGFNVKAVVTVADKPAGRGLKIKHSPVKEFAVSYKIPVLQPENLKDPVFISTLKNLNANLFVIVAFRKLPEEVWSLPELGSFNLHASLLPEYRGAAPINHAIINGEQHTGVTTFFLNAGIDAGSIIMSETLAIGRNETAGELHDRLKVMGAQLVIKTIEAIRDDAVSPKVQITDGAILRNAPRLFRKDCKIDWRRPAREVHNLIRGLSPFPGAFSVLTQADSEREIKILRSLVTNTQTSSGPGGVWLTVDGKILVACGDLFIEVLILQPAGKKVMKGPEFVRGLKSENLVFKAPELIE
ncbi:MAG: methionyl-tRNA formyltransferase [Lentimicrobium sp.]|nr:methionyl-tRNA formyltransferase [Lentimicrobium sp.]